MGKKGIASFAALLNNFIMFFSFHFYFSLCKRAKIVKVALS